MKTSNEAAWVAVYWAVGRAVDQAVYWAVERAVHRAVGGALWWTSRAVTNPRNEDPPHPALQDYLGEIR